MWGSLELRYVFMLFINILKSFVGAMNDHTWDALGVTTNWNSFLILSIIFLLLSFFSITISLPSSRPCPTIQLRFQPFCPLTLSSFFASLILPQRACWFYFLALWVSTHEIVNFNLNHSFCSVSGNNSVYNPRLRHRRHNCRSWWGGCCDTRSGDGPTTSNWIERSSIAVSAIYSYLFIILHACA